MTTENTTTQAPVATPDAREALLSLIGITLERIRATPETRIDYLQESMDLLEQVEAWTKDRHPAGELILRDPADAITIQEIA